MIGSNMYQQEMLAKLRQQELQQLAATHRLSRQVRLHQTLLQRIVVRVGGRPDLGRSLFAAAGSFRRMLRTGNGRPDEIGPASQSQWNMGLSSQLNMRRTRSST